MHTEWDDIIINIPQQWPILACLEDNEETLSSTISMIWYQEAELIILHESLFKKGSFPDCFSRIHRFKTELKAKKNSYTYHKQ